LLKLTGQLRQRLLALADGAVQFGHRRRAVVLLSIRQPIDLAIIPVELLTQLTKPREHVIASVQGPTDERIRYGRGWEEFYAHEPSLYRACGASPPRWRYWIFQVSWSHTIRGSSSAEIESAAASARMDS